VQSLEAQWEASFLLDPLFSFFSTVEFNVARQAERSKIAGMNRELEASAPSAQAVMTERAPIGGTVNEPTRERTREVQGNHPSSPVIPGRVATHDTIEPIPSSSLSTPPIPTVAPQRDAEHPSLPTYSALPPSQPISDSMSNADTEPSSSIRSPFSSAPTERNTNAGQQSLSEEQATFIQSLYDNNVPAPAIASIINRMIQSRQGGGEGSGEGSTVTSAEFARVGMPSPPEYDFKDGR
jgi:hypothetical protein